MNQIPIKIKKSEIESQVPPKPALKEIPPKKSASNKRVFWWIMAIILAAESATLIFIFFKKSTELEKILPKNAAGIISFEKTETEEIFLNLEDKNWLWPPLKDLKKASQEFLAQNKIDFQKITETFDEKIILVFLKNEQNNFEWLGLAKIKIDSGDFEKNLAEIKKNLEQNFNISSETYRQIEIWQIKNVSSQSPPIFYADVKNYFLIGSSQKIIEQAIDRALKIKK